MTPSPGSAFSTPIPEFDAMGIVWSESGFDEPEVGSGD